MIASSGPRRSKVYLVGAGPGDPKLLTLRAYELLRSADVVVHDKLISQQVLDLIPPGAVRIDVGKSPRYHRLVAANFPTQTEINHLLLDHARRGKEIIVRLKGGDPTLFGRGGEEAEFLRAHGVDFEIVPGVSSALGAPAYAGIPVTHRGHSSSVAIVTGHEDPVKSKSISWSQLARSVDTIVILMGAANLQRIAKKLIDSGMSEGTDVAAVESATTAAQKTVLFTLGDAASGRVVDLVSSPSTIVVGDVANLARRLSWRTDAVVDLKAVGLKVKEGHSRD